MSITIYQLVGLWVFAFIGFISLGLALYAVALHIWEVFDRRRHDYLKRHIDEVCRLLQMVLLTKGASQEALWALEIVTTTLHTRWHQGRHELRHSMPPPGIPPRLLRGYRVWYDGCDPEVPVWSSTGKAEHYRKARPWTEEDTAALKEALRLD